MLCRNPVDRILSAYEFIVEVAVRKWLRTKPGKKVRAAFADISHTHLHLLGAEPTCNILRRNSYACSCCFPDTF